MGIWAEIKMALNSTLLTPDFKPLDLVIQDSFIAGRELIASDTPYKLLIQDGDYTVEGSGAQQTIVTIKPKTDGSLRLKWDDFRTTSANNSTGCIYKNGVSLFSPPVSTSTMKPDSVDILYSKGDTIEVTLTVSSSMLRGHFKIKNLMICADVIDGRVLEVTL